LYTLMFFYTLWTYENLLVDLQCRDIENLKEELIDNKGEIIHIYNKSDGYGFIG